MMQRCSAGRDLPRMPSATTCTEFKCCTPGHACDWVALREIFDARPWGGGSQPVLLSGVACVPRLSALSDLKQVGLVSSSRHAPATDRPANSGHLFCSGT